MSKPWIHAQSSAKKFGGKPEDYLDIHSLLDISKGAIADSRHRGLTHSSWFIMHILPRIFGETFKNSDSKVISTRDIGETHVLEDFHGKFIPTAQDYLQEMEIKDWMVNGKGYPSSYQKLEEKHQSKIKDKTEVAESLKADKKPKIERGPIFYDGSKLAIKPIEDFNINDKLID